MKYDVALSYAGEDREYVEAVAAELKNLGIQVFYDKFETVNSWGKNLYTHLQNVYQNEAKYTVIFISEHYAKKLWTNHERKSAQTRAFTEAEEYLLPARFDDTEIEGIPETVGYIDLNNYSPREFAKIVSEKSKLKNSAISVKKQNSNIFQISTLWILTVLVIISTIAIILWVYLEKVYFINKNSPNINLDTNLYKHVDDNVVNKVLPPYHSFYYKGVSVIYENGEIENGTVKITLLIASNETDNYFELRRYNYSYTPKKTLSKVISGNGEEYPLNKVLHNGKDVLQPIVLKKDKVERINLIVCNYGGGTKISKLLLFIDTSKNIKQVFDENELRSLPLTIVDNKLQFECKD